MHLEETKMKILAVDDDPIILELLEHFISTISDYELTTAESVCDALEILSEPGNTFDCFLLDIQMPHTDGIEFTQILRDTPKYERTPILMLTAMSDKDYIDRAFSAGATDYVTKPFEVNSLKGRLKLVEQISQDARQAAQKMLAREVGFDPVKATSKGIELHEPFPIHDVEGVIENRAIENYVTQLSRKSLCGSVILGFSVRQSADLFYDLSNYDFSCVMTDVAEAISDCLLPTQRLLSYAGNGSFVCVVEGAAKIDMDRLVDQINLYIHHMELSQSDGSPLNIRICAGRPTRLVWRKGSSALEALREANLSAEHAAECFERNMGSIWTTEQFA